MNNSKYYFLILFLEFLWLSVSAQSDSLNTENSEDSIVYLIEHPVIINKSVTHEEEVYKNWFLELNGTAFFHINSYCTCDNLITYKTEMKKSNHSRLGNGIGFNIMNISNRRRLVYSIGTSYTAFRENFKQQENDSSLVVSFKNKYSYIDLNIGVGYWILRKRKHVSIIINSKLIGSKLLLNSGSTIDYKDVYKIITNDDANRDAKFVLSGVLGIKIIALNDRRLKIFAEPFTRANFTSVLDYAKHYYQRRWASGVAFGLIFTL